MQIVIDIEEKIFEELTKYDEPIPSGNHLYNSALSSIYNGVPLPEHHGRLVDISKIDEDRMESDNPIMYLTINGQYIEAISLDYLNDLPTIIEAEDEDGR